MCAVTMSRDRAFPAGAAVLEARAAVSISASEPNHFADR